MLTGVEASTLPGFQVGGLAALLASMDAGGGWLLCNGRVRLFRL
jgi:hypothetical protein